MSKVKRVYHTWDKWECYPSGFYDKKPSSGLTNQECEFEYKELLTNLNDFEVALSGVLMFWVNSCEHYLSNEKMNRIAWLGQASLCFAKGIPSSFRSGFSLLTEQEQLQANNMALKYLNQWLLLKGYDSVDLEKAGAKITTNQY